MEQQKWKLGDRCFIVETCMTPSCVRMEVMPAVINHVGGIDGRVVTGESVCTKGLGPISIIGTHFSTEDEARSWIQGYIEQVQAAGKHITLTGQRPDWNVPANVPRNGDTVYTIDAETREILEVKVGIVQLEFGKLRVGYDQSPENPEASNIETHSWFPTREAAEMRARQRGDGEYVFVPARELAIRVNASIDKLWSGATERMKVSTP